MCFKGGREDTELLSDNVPFSSSRCTAMEKRRQKAGSRTPAMAYSTESISSDDNPLRRSVRLMNSLGSSRKIVAIRPDLGVAYFAVRA